ncbi:MAG: glutamate--tRNA ligase [Bacteroidia bacterium]
MSDRKVRVRFAPSPTGPLHIGGVRTALYNYLFAKKSGGDFILRIEDTDQGRYVPGAEQYIIDSLKWVGIEPNEGVGFGDGPHAPYRQSERKDTYRQFAEQLVKSGHAYYAFDTSEELEALRKKLEAAKAPVTAYGSAVRMEMKNSLTLSADEVAAKLSAGEQYVIRIKIAENEEVKVQDLIRGEVVFSTSLMDDKVLFKSDGMPTYHLANVADDYAMQITHVIRGEEWLSSAPLHVLLYRYLGWENKMPQFAHLPLLLKPDGNGKLSKRDGDKLGFPVFPLEFKDPKTGEISSGYREKGYLPESVINIIAFLGWNPGTEQEIYSLEQLVDAFSMEHVHKAGAKFNFEKAKWFNEHYIKTASDERLANHILPLATEKFGVPDLEFLKKVCALLKDRVSFVNDIVLTNSYVFAAPANYSPEALKKLGTPNLQGLGNLEGFINSIEEFSPATIESALKQFAEMQQVKLGDLMKFTRISIVGDLSGPGVPDLMVLLGKEETIKRVNRFLQTFK